jgi:hypothetical protein
LGKAGAMGHLIHTSTWSKDWLARNQYNVSEWSDMSTCGLLFLWNQYNVSEWSDMSTCGLLFLWNQYNVSEWRTAMELKIFLNIYLSSDWERQGPWAIWYIQFCNSV